MSVVPAPERLRLTGTGLVQALPTQRPDTGYDYWIANNEDSEEWTELKKEIQAVNIPLPETKKGKTPNHELEALISDPNSEAKLIAFVAKATAALKQKEQQNEKKKEKEMEQKTITGGIYKAIHAATPVIAKSFDFMLATLNATDFIAGEITVGTHYSVALKAVTLFYTAYKEAGKLADDIDKAFFQIGQYTPELELLSSNIKNPQMHRAIFRLRVAFVKFFVGATKYMNKNLFVKMAIYIGGQNKNFSGLIDEITAAYSEATRIRGVVQLVLTLEGLREINGLGEDNKKLGLMLADVAKNIASLDKPYNWNKDANQQLLSVYSSSKFQADLHVQSFRTSFFTHSYDPVLEMAFNDRERKFLSPRDRWHRNFRGFVGGKQWNPLSREARAIEQPPMPRVDGEPQPLFWITGSIGHRNRNISWVSSFSIDLLRHLPEVSNVEAFAIFCKRGFGTREVRYTPALLIKGLIIQLLERYPEVAIENIRHLPPSRFNAVGDFREEGAAERAWLLLEDILGLVMRLRTLQNCEILFLIDRLDLCAASADFDVRRDLLPRLQQLSHDFIKVRVIVTVAEVPAGKVSTLYTGPSWLLAYGRIVYK